MDRRGLAPSVAFASTQTLEIVMPVELGEQMPMVIDAKVEGEKLRYQQSIAVIGTVARRVKIAT